MCLTAANIAHTEFSYLSSGRRSAAVVLFEDRWLREADDAGSAGEQAVAGER
jgi:hypothetical protein